MSLARSPLRYLGVPAKNPPETQRATRAPLTTDTAYRLNTLWIYTTIGAVYELTGIIAGSANWTLLGNAGGALDTLTGDSGVATPVAGNINILGTANQIATLGSGDDITLSLPAVMIAPGSFATTTTLAVGTNATVGGTLGVTGLTTLAGLTQIGTANLNASGAGTTTIGSTSSGATSISSGGTLTLDVAAAQAITIGATQTSGTMNIGGTGANTGTVTLWGGTGAQTLNLLNSTGGKTLNIATGAGVNILTIGSTNTTSALTLQSGSGGIAMTGVVTLANNLILNGNATQLQMQGGAVTDFIGTATLSSGTTGAIANTNIAAGDRIFAVHIAPGASTALGILTYVISAGASFTISSRNPADATVQTGDVSTVAYMIVRQI